MTYIVTFGITAFFVHRYQIAALRKKKDWSVFFAILAIMIPTVLGGIRSPYLGTDNLAYRATFNVYANRTMASFVNLILRDPRMIAKEPGMTLLYYIVSRFTRDYHWMCFVTELISMVFLFKGLDAFREEIPMWLGMLVYLFCYYCLCINLVKQSMALSISFYSIKYIRENKIGRFLLLTLLATMFHYSALLIIPHYIIYHYIMGGDDGRMRTIRVIIISMIYILLSQFLPMLVRTMSGLGILAKSYSAYTRGIVTIDYGETVSRLPLLLIATAMYKPVSKKNPLYCFLYTLLWSEIALAQFGTINYHGYRISLYAGYGSIVALPMLIQGGKNKASRFMISVLLLLYLFIFWDIYTVHNMRGFHYPVYPYMTDLF